LIDAPGEHMFVRRVVFYPPGMHPRRAFPALLLVVALAACGGPDGVDPKQWARSVCGALAPWRSEISSLTTKTQQQLSTAKTAAQTKTNVVALLAGAEASSEKARQGVVGAGVPAVDHGAEIAKQFTLSLERARDAYGHAKTTISGLPVKSANDKTFYAGVRTTFDTLQSEYAQSELHTDNVGSKDLQKAIDEVPECR
jgi:hypothetical protein